jgi:DNA-binding CsgD family transcriptional regulator
VAFPGNSEVDLLLALQEGAVGEAGWGDVLSRLAAMTGASFAALAFRSAASGAMPAITAARPSGVVAGMDATALAAMLSDRVRPERIYTESDLAEIANAEERSLFEQTVIRLGTPSIRVMRVVIPDVASIVLGIFGKGSFDAADSAVLRRLFPYLQNAARIAVRLARDRARARTTADLARSANFGWFMLDRSGVVIESSAAGKALPRGIRILSGLQGDRLAFAERAAESTLAEILQHFAIEADGPVRAVRIGHDPPLHLRIAPVLPGLRAQRAVALATLHGEARVLPGAVDLLVDLFGLLPSEARLAVAIADGHSLADSADLLELTIETARNYSKRIFAKTGTQGQPDLVRLVFANGLAGPVADSAT